MLIKRFQGFVDDGKKLKVGDTCLVEILEVCQSFEFEEREVSGRKADSGRALRRSWSFVLHHELTF